MDRGRGTNSGVLANVANVAVIKSVRGHFTQMCYTPENKALVVVTVQDIILWRSRGTVTYDVSRQPRSRYKWVGHILEAVPRKRGRG